MSSKLTESKLPCPNCPSSVITAASLANKRWRRKHPEKARRMDREGARRWRKANRLRSLLISCKRRAKLKGILFNLIVDDLPNIPENCPVLGIPIKQNLNKRTDHSPSIDRINNSLGYVKGNVRIISYRANRFKSDMCKEECELLMKDFNEQNS